MTAALDLATTPTRTIDARGSFCPGPLMELIRAIREGQTGDVLAVISSDNGSRTDIPAWVHKAGHELVGVYPHDAYDEIVVRKLR
jgi:TusA-related sulfurtransferase